MTDVANPRKAAPGSVAAQLIEQARAEGVSLVGPGSPLAALTKQVLETALEAELDEHLGYEHGDRDGEGRREQPQRAQRHPGKTVHTELGPVTIEVPRDRTARSNPWWSVNDNAGCQRGRCDGAVAVGEGIDHWGDLPTTSRRCMASR
jgi:hypothetical protein